MSNPFEKRETSHSTLLIVLGSVVGALFLLLLVCGGVSYFVLLKAGQALGPQLQAQADLMGADMAVQAFLNDLSLGQLDAAYDSTTPAFRDKQTLPQFKKFVEGNPLLTKFMTAQHDAANPAAGARQMTLHYTLNGNGDAPPLTMTVQVVKDGQQWKVDSVSVP